VSRAARAPIRHGHEQARRRHLFSAVMSDCLYLDADAVARELGYGRGGMRAIVDGAPVTPAL
jgi:hypothetical protein